MFNKEYLRRVLSEQSSSYKDDAIRSFISDELDQITDVTCNVDNYGNIYVTKGFADVYPTAVCHIDTVHEIKLGYSVMEVDDIFFAFDSYKREQTGVGGDDKVGIYICLQLLKDLDVIKCVFFRDEEVGCVGSGKAHMDFFKDSSMVLQADRRGNNDFIQNSNGCDLISEEFIKTIDPVLEKYGYDLDYGTITDVGELKSNGLAVCCANVSCGYYNAHSDDEYVVISEVETCYALFVELFEKFGNRQWEHTYDKKPYSGGYGDWDRWGGQGSIYNDYYNSRYGTGANKCYWSHTKKAWVYPDELPMTESGGGGKKKRGKKKRGVKSATLDTSFEVEDSLVSYQIAVEKIEYGMDGLIDCPSCLEVSDFAFDPSDTGCLMCNNCFDYIESRYANIQVNYHEIVEMGASAHAQNGNYCHCHKGHVDPLTYESECRMCILDCGMDDDPFKGYDDRGVDEEFLRTLHGYDKDEPAYSEVLQPARLVN